MPGYYIYLISSLPMLHFGVSPQLSLEEFLTRCRRLISEQDFLVLKDAAKTEGIYKGSQPTLKKSQVFDTALRNELVKIRAARKKIDPARYLRDDSAADPALAHIAINAQRNPSLLESERMLDAARWRMLDELSAGHYFDIDFLIIYYLKLSILERWKKINTADREQLIKQHLEKGA